MTPEQLRQALGELSGDRSATFGLSHCVGESACITVHSAMLIPDEPDHLVKLTDGASIFILDAERVAWVRIGSDVRAVHKGNHH